MAFIHQKALLLIVIILLISGQAQSGTMISPLSEPVTADAIINFVKNNDIKKIEDLLPYLPKNTRSNFTLMYGSRATQGSSYESPRVVMFGENGKLVLTFNGDPSQKKFNQLELMQFNDRTKNFELHEITFPENTKSSSSAHISNGESCVQCHQNPPRPIWEKYSHWPGAYGGNDDDLDPNRIKKQGDMGGDNGGSADQREIDGLQSFLKNRKKNARYQYLEVDNSEYGPYTFESKSKSIEQRPNERILAYLMRLNAQKVVMEMKRNENYAKLSTILEISALNCKLDSRLKADVLKYTGITERKPGPYDYFDPLSLGLIHDDLLKDMGVNIEEWSLRRIPKDEDLRYFHDGFASMANMVDSLILKDTGDRDPKLKNKISFSSSNYFKSPIQVSPKATKIYLTLDKEGAVISDKTITDACPVLISKLKVQLREDKSKQVSCNFPIVSNSLDPILRLPPNQVSTLMQSTTNDKSGLAPPIALQSCISCHSNSDNAPKIPWTKPNELAKMLKANPELVSKTKFMISDEAGARQMPLNDSALSPNDQNLIEKYLRNLAN